MGAAGPLRIRAMDADGRVQTFQGLFKTARWHADHGLVFRPPATGEPLYRRGGLRCFQKALTAAGLDEHPSP